ncbi:hypothetical protein HUJ05_007748 [Dendroctonus ponderosae]|nr:hypothetical protein HUJ05_007748 [Dendroctonus ponderosae]
MADSSDGLKRIIDSIPISDKIGLRINISKTKVMLISCNPNNYFDINIYDVYSTVLYGIEAWTLKVSSINRLEAFEMWVYRVMLRGLWKIIPPI